MQYKNNRHLDAKTQNHETAKYVRNVCCLSCLIKMLNLFVLT